MFFLLPASGSHILSGIHILQLPRIPCFIPVYLLRMGRQNCSSSLVSQKPLELRHIIYRKDGRTSVSSPAGNCSKTCFSCFPAIYQAGNGLFRQPGLIAYSKTDSIQASLLQFLFQRLQGKMNGMRNSKAAVSVFYCCKTVRCPALKNLLVLAYQNFSAENCFGKSRCLL